MGSAPLVVSSGELLLRATVELFDSTVTIYADEGISGTTINNRIDFLRMIEDCKAGKIDLIVVKDVSRFARNIKDFMNTVEVLSELDPPVGVFFEKNNLNILDVGTKILLTILAMLAELESELKSKSVGLTLCGDRKSLVIPATTPGLIRPRNPQIRQRDFRDEQRIQARAIACSASSLHDNFT